MHNWVDSFYPTVSEINPGKEEKILFLDKILQQYILNFSPAFWTLFIKQGKLQRNVLVHWIL